MSIEKLEETVAALSAEVNRLQAQQRASRKVRIGLLAAAVTLIATAALAQPAITSFSPNTPAKASEMNGNFAQVAQFLVPQHGIIFYDGPGCPTGWTQVAQGRTIVARPNAGSSGAVFGTALTDNTPRAVSLGTALGGFHSHGGRTNVLNGGPDYSTGEVNWTVTVGSTNAFSHSHVINADGNHTHGVTGNADAVLPYVYYTACRKN